MLPNIPLPEAPSESSIYNTPYGVVTSYEAYGEVYPGRFNGKVVATVPSYNGMDNALDLLIVAMSGAAKNEKAREKQLIEAYINKIPQGTKLRKDFEELILNEKYSQAFDTLQKAMHDIYDFNKTLQENQAHFTEINEFYLNKTFINNLADVLGKTSHVTTEANFNNINLDMTGEQIIDNILTNAEKQASQHMDNKELIRYKNFLLQIKSYIEKIFIESYGSNSLNHAISNLENNKKVKAQRKKDNGKHANDPLNQLVWNQVWGLLNGMSTEITISLNGGVQTGSIKNDLGQNIKSDAYTIMTAEGGFVFEEKEQEKLNLQQITHKNELDTFLQQGAFEDNFIISSSAKDQSLAASFSGKFSDDAIKFAEPASLNQRIADIRDFGSSAGLMGSGIDDLIFALVNLEHDMVCAGAEGAVKKALGAICANWMFDDVGDIVTNISMENDATKICVYFINGWYITLGDILQRTVDKLSKNKQQDLVTVSLSIPKGSSYGDAAKSTEPGLERWDTTRSIIMDSTKLGFRLRVKNLFNAFY